MIEIVKQSHAVRGGRFESSLLTWPVEPNTHVWEPSHPHDSFPFFPVRGSGSSPSTTEYNYSTCAWRDHPERLQKRMNDHSTRRFNQVLKLTDYHISRHVASTFKSLMKCATHRDLNLLVTTQTGNHKYHILARGPYITAECKSISTPIISRVVGN